MKFESEGRPYDACQFEINGRAAICRSSKITPKKIGQFVTCWQRNAEGKTSPFHEDDGIELYLICVESSPIHEEKEEASSEEPRRGQFVFPRKVLIKRGIMSSEMNEGKRGFRVYPSWSRPTNKQAQKTQSWQLKFFFEYSACLEQVDVEAIKTLYSLDE